mmetsp:Transcript_2968/g.8785  ORF Transcript_2968/g.8785 Transcript_2968/m.8785 type:complete len:915 (+) Transcript_2968:45-2789(+)
MPRPSDEFDMKAGKGSGIGDQKLLLAGLVALISTTVSLFYNKRELLFDLLQKNQILQAFFASTVFGVLSYTLVIIWNLLSSAVRSATFSSVTITNKDENFEKIVNFIGTLAPIETGALMAQTEKKKKTFKDWKQEFLMGERRMPRMEFVPANNNDVHMFAYKGVRIVMARTKGETVVAGWERMPMQLETLVLSTWRGGNKILKDLVNDAIASSFEAQTDQLSVFVLAGGWIDGWELALTKKPRPLDSVILDEDLAEGLVADARDFLQAAEWYQAVGIPYRRGYLLHGPPGCGKTSFCQALAGELRLDVCMLTLTNKNLNDNKLAESLRDAPPNSIVLLEDVDAVFVDRTAAAASASESTGVTFSGLLNAIDGVASQEGRLFFMTTNHLDKLDPALVRPGRCDVKVELRRASHKQAALLFERFYPEAKAHAPVFANALPEFELSMAQLQGFLLEHKKDPDGALAHLPRLLLVSKPPVHVNRTSIYDHLRRVGLERFAPTLEYHGFHSVADAHGLTLDEAKRFSGELRADVQSARRLGQLLAGDPKLMEDYQLADMATVKEMFLETFAKAPQPDTILTPAASRVASGASGVSGHSASARRPSFHKQASDGLRLVSVDVSESSELSRRADELCAMLQREGKGVVSVWQLRRHLRLFEHSVEACLCHARALTAPRKRGCGALLAEAGSAYELLRRACCEDAADSVEAEGYTRGAQLFALDEGELKDSLGFKGERLARLTAVLTGDTSKPEHLRRFMRPDRRGLRDMFLATFADPALPGGAAEPAALSAHADDFAEALVDDQGDGLVSLLQIEVYLERVSAKGAGACAAEARAELVDKPRPAAPPAAETPEPTDWVHGWLKAAKLEEWADKFIDHELKDRADLLLEPRLDLAGLEAIGVNKAGAQRRILAMINKLATEP